MRKVLIVLLVVGLLLGAVGPAVTAEEEPFGDDFPDLEEDTSLNPGTIPCGGGDGGGGAPG